jgi:transposase
MSPGSPITHFAGFDWAKHSHHVVIVDAAGQIVTEFRFEHTEAGWQHWRRQAERFAPLAVAVESEPRYRRRPAPPNPRLHDLST